ncbi:class I SAM-dependent methyltransferase [Burkholderia sp. NLJ2]|uniref:class I SAM-dependent methyltransferase n=1 Tax=Burkholderia sp. NLJ2 TaxID=3090699 RepID=UPI003C6BE4C4
MRLTNDPVLSQMVDVYAAIYGDHYALTERAMAPAMETVRSDLERLAIQPDALARMTVFNIGTGREAAAFHRLGAKRIVHADLSPLAVRSMLALAARAPGHSRIHSVRLDICKPGTQVAQGCRIDLAYLNGVLHHLYDPATALRNLLPRLGDDGTLFLRFYRSGSFLFFVVDLLRRFIGIDDRATFTALTADGATLHDDSDPWLYSDLYDDLFVPVLKLIPPDKLDAFMASCGFAPALPAELAPAYDHGPGTDAFVAAAYRRASDGPSDGPPSEFPASVDQLHGIRYRDATHLETIEVAQDVVQRIARLDAGTRIRAAISIYRLARDNGMSAAERHRALRDLLREAT